MSQDVQRGELNKQDKQLFTPNIDNADRIRHDGPSESLAAPDTMETTEDFAIKIPERKGLSEKQRKIVAFVMASLVLAGVAIGTILGSSKNKATAIPSPTEQSSNPTSTQETIPSASIEAINDPDHTLLYELDWSQQSEELQKLNEMTLEEFRGRPRDEQLFYFSFINHVYFNSFYRGGYDVKTEDFIFSSSESASSNDSAEEIINQCKTNLLVADSAQDETGAFDSAEARKLLSSYLSDVNFGINPNDKNDFFIEHIDAGYARVPKGEEIPRVLNYDNLEMEEGISRSDLKYRDDNTPYVIVKMHDAGGNEHIIEFELITFKNFIGDQQSIWLMSSDSLR